MDIQELKIHSPLLKLLGGEASQGETKEVEEWRNTSPENLILSDSLRENYSNAGKNIATDSKTDKAFLAVSEKLYLHNTYSTDFSTWIFRAAAILVIVLALAFLFTSQEKNRFIANTSDGIFWDTLPDGSVVCLNQHSELVLDKSFNKDTRELALTGEAWFDVVPDKSKPFTVNIDSLKVKVTGTSFNIRSSRQNQSTEVFVESGKVQFYYFGHKLNDNSFKLDLRPGELARYENNTVSKIPGSDTNYLAWKTGVLVFEKAPLSKVVEKVEEFFGVRINCALPNPDRYLVTARFDKKKPESILQGINERLHAGYGADKNIFVISNE